MSKIETTPISTWQFYSACKHTLGMSTLNKIYSGVKGKKCPNCKEPITETRERQINRWAANPDFTESNQKNPVDRIETLLNLLIERGRDDLAIAAVDRFAKIVGCHLVCEGEVVPDKGTLEEELLDTWPAVSDFQTAMREKQPVPIVRDLYRHAKRELDEDMVIYEQNED